MNIDILFAFRYTHIQYLCPASAQKNVIMQSTFCVATRLTDASVEQILMDFQSEF